MSRGGSEEEYQKGDVGGYYDPAFEAEIAEMARSAALMQTMFIAMHTVIVLGSVSVIYRLSRGPLFPNFNDLDYVERQTLAGIGLVGTLLFFGAIAASIHAGIIVCREIKDRSNYSVQVAEDNEISMSERNTSINETTGLMGQDREGASVYRVGNCHPLRAVYPATPLKTAIWIPIIGLAAFAVVSMIKPDLFNEFAGNTLIASSNFTNCSAWSNATFADSTACVSVMGYFLGLSTLVITALNVPFVVAGAAAFFHAKAADAGLSCCSLPTVSNEFKA